MSTYFSKVLRTGNKQREFNFRLLSPADPTRYSVDVPTESGERILLQLRQEEGGEWKIVGASLPAWIEEAKDALAEAVAENQQLEAARKNSAT